MNDDSRRVPAATLYPARNMREHTNVTGLLVSFRLVVLLRCDLGVSCASKQKMRGDV